MPEPGRGPCGDQTLTMQSGSKFDTIASAAGADHVTRAIAVLPDQRVNLTAGEAGRSLSFKIAVPDPAAVIVAVDLAPKVVDLTHAQLLEQLDEIAAPDAVRIQLKNADALHEQYVAHAKTFLRCGTAEATLKQNIGYRQTDMGLELVPQLPDPTALRAGDEFRVILVAQDTPGRHDGTHTTLIRDVPIVISSEGEGRVAVVQPTASGVLSFVIPKAGRYTIRATRLRPAESGDAGWISDATTLTFTVE